MDFHYKHDKFEKIKYRLKNKLNKQKEENKRKIIENKIKLEKEKKEEKRKIIENKIKLEKKKKKERLKKIKEEETKIRLIKEKEEEKKLKQIKKEKEKINKKCNTNIRFRTLHFVSNLVCKYLFGDICQIIIDMTYDKLFLTSEDKNNTNYKPNSIKHINNFNMENKHSTHYITSTKECGELHDCYIFNGFPLLVDINIVENIQYNGKCKSDLNKQLTIIKNKIKCLITKIKTINDKIKKLKNLDFNDSIRYKQLKSDLEYEFEMIKIKEERSDLKYDETLDEFELHTEHIGELKVKMNESKISSKKSDDKLIKLRKSRIEYEKEKIELDEKQQLLKKEHDLIFYNEHDIIVEKWLPFYMYKHINYMDHALKHNLNSDDKIIKFANDVRKNKETKRDLIKNCNYIYYCKLEKNEKVKKCNNINMHHDKIKNIYEYNLIKFNATLTDFNFCNTFKEHCICCNDSCHCSNSAYCSHNNNYLNPNYRYGRDHSDDSDEYSDDY
jgi:hypothetical protein